MKIEYIIIYENCGKDKKSHVIKPNSNIEYWDEAKIRREGVMLSHVSEILVGPKTVLEIFSDSYFNGNTHKIINDNLDQGKVYTIGCPTDKNWKPQLGSFIMWTYDHYTSVHGIPFCENDKDCKNTEMCLCKHGQSHPSWCPNSKRRCLNKGYFTYEMPLNLNDDDEIDMECYNKEFSKVRLVSDGTFSKALNNDISRRCAKDKISTIDQIEHFQTNNDLILIVLVCLLMYLLFSR